MKLAAHELQDLHELTLGCVNSITNMSYMLQHVQDPEFKSILERHYPFHIRDYNMKVEYLNQTEGAKKSLPLFKEQGTLSNYTQSPVNEYSPVQPRTVVHDMNDREMATAYLLTLKRAGREYAYSAMEAANPELRSFLQTAFMMSCSHAYDIWQYMIQKGYYPLEPADETMISKIGAAYETVQENQEIIQQALNEYKGSNPIAGKSDQMFQ
ncbi:spore coat protein [Bacillus aquiflavi]|uniref:Spore coat protein n=1 Tax=Bacillus aquiflavi TaxID=2672567 RepID=A0A6B3W247_9BACI|nr:spore coat protein [Bacillus aquiflavi]MBA4537347.1 spore coat protein [Bacillus aquiflavi]NEY81604.1 spore coat protein [Bacillus aquiflavi]